MGNKLSLIRHDFNQCFGIPEPSLTEQNLPDQSNKVFLVTGGYAGVGFELVKILYQKNAKVYIAGRSQDKANQAISTTQAEHKNSTGSLHFLHVDLSDLTSIKTSAQDFLGRESALHVLWNNAGVMIPPKGSKGPQGHELQMVTNCLGPWLFTKLLTPLLESTAKSAAVGNNSVRVCWAGSLAIDAASPEAGVVLDQSAAGAAKVHNDPQTDYGQSKAGNLLMASEYGRQHPSIVSTCFNPGNLMSELQRHLPSWQVSLIKWILYEPRFGAYTELYCGLSPDLTTSDNGRYIAPWGRKSHVRDDVTLALKSSAEGGSGQAAAFVQWMDKETQQFT